MLFRYLVWLCLKYCLIYLFLRILNHYNNDINNHSTEIQNKVDICSKNQPDGYKYLPMFVARLYFSNTREIKANTTSWLGLEENGYFINPDNTTNPNGNYIAKNKISDYNWFGIVGFGCGTINSIPIKLTVCSIGNTGFRIFNPTSSSITPTTKLEFNSDGSYKNHPPFLDMLLVRKDICER